MAVDMTKVKCPMRKGCKYSDGCIVVNSVDDGARFSPVLRLKLESLVWKVKCFSFVEDNIKE